MPTLTPGNHQQCNLWRQQKGAPPSPRSCAECGLGPCKNLSTAPTPHPENSGWIGVDLDGTIAHYDGWKGPHHIGEPIPLMLQRVREMIDRGERVKIFTARVSMADRSKVDADYPATIRKNIQDWTEKHLGARLEVVCEKDFNMIQLWDDRAVQVFPNSGLRADGKDNPPHWEEGGYKV